MQQLSSFFWVKNGFEEFLPREQVYNCLPHFCYNVAPMFKYIFMHVQSRTLYRFIFGKRNYTWIIFVFALFQFLEFCISGLFVLGIIV